MGRLQELHDTYGQSPWLDNLRRGWITSGEIQEWIDRGVRGITSNPSIFQKSIQGSADYDEQFNDVVRSGASVTDAYWDLVTEDIGAALKLLRPVHDSSGGEDGYVSVEVAPSLARDRAGTEAAARVLSSRIVEPNLLVKIPATAEGIPAIEQMIAEGCPINVTLIFSLDRYDAVMDAYIRGLERLAEDPAADLSKVASVASFFISRVDTEVDRRLEAVGTDQARALKGRAAYTQGRLAYAAFGRAFSGARWAALEARGARVQRPLWASTSTKDPSYPDTLYVDTLIGPDTVNTIPDATLVAFDDHGTLARTVDADPDGDAATWAALSDLVDFDDVGDVLESEGVASFAKSFDELIGSLEAKAGDLGA